MNVTLRPLALTAALVLVGTTACTDAAATDVITELLATGRVTLGTDGYFPGNVRFVLTAGGTPIDVPTDAQGNYSAQLSIGTEYHAFPHGSGVATLCEESLFTSQDSEVINNFRCQLPTGRWELSYSYVSDTCGFGSIDAYTAEYDWTSLVNGDVVLEHVGDAPPLSGSFDDLTRQMQLATEWIQVDDDTEVMEEIELGLEWFPNSDLNLSGVSYTTARQISTGALCGVQLNLVTRRGN